MPTQSVSFFSLKRSISGDCLFEMRRDLSLHGLNHVTRQDRSGARTDQDAVDS